MRKDFNGRRIKVSLITYLNVYVEMETQKLSTLNKALSINSFFYTAVYKRISGPVKTELC